MSDTRQLKREDIKGIMRVEENSFIPPIRTTKENILRRLGLGHVYLGVTNNAGEIVGTLAMRYAKFSPRDGYDKFPKTFKEYAEHSNEKDANAAFVYSIGVLPECRRGFYAKKLLQSAKIWAKKNGMNYMVGDSRCPSYAGSNNFPQEHFDFKPVVRDAIDISSFRGAESTDNLKKDPILGFYIKTMGAKTLWAIPNFFPQDIPCGGFMVIQYIEL